jgi:exfoliative toxin A/B
MKNIIRKIPIPISGLMLALAATGNLVLPYGKVYRNIFGSMSAVVLLLLLLKMIIDSKSVLESLKNPVIASVFPAFFMGIMILATYLKPLSFSISFAMWIIGLTLHCVFIIYFTQKYILSFDIKKVFPSYFLVYVGIVVGSVTAPTYNLFKLGQYIFWFGFICYLCLLPIVIYRVVITKKIPEPAMPTITIFAAPASLCLTGYISSFQNKNIYLLSFLAILSLILVFLVILYLPKMLKLRFYPSYSAFTFPFVISAISIKQTNLFLIKTNRAIPILKYVVKFEEVLAISLVIYVLVRYLQFLFQDTGAAQEQQTGKISV